MGSLLVVVDSITNSTSIRDPPTSKLITESSLFLEFLEAKKMSATEEKITVLLADDHPVTREGISKTLEQAADICVIGEAGDGIETEKLVSQLRPKVLVLDLIMPGSRPSEIEKWVRENFPETITLILTAHDRDAYLAQMMDAGVAGYLSKNESGERLISAIRRVAKGTNIFDEQQFACARRWKNEVEVKLKSLTQREREILRLVAEGRENKEIAHIFYVALRTIEKHLANIYEKLAVKSKTEAALWWAKNGSDFTN
jgi:two-component system response regulator DegU